VSQPWPGGISVLLARDLEGNVRFYPTEENTHRRNVHTSRAPARIPEVLVAQAENPEARLHLYGKKRASSGCKMGHVLVFGVDADHAGELAESIAGELEHRTPPSGWAWT
jgi:phosphoribosylaminoimidazole carboxylase (NCAIR synthetase)